MFSLGEAVHGRGASGNPPNRFEKIDYQPDPDAPDDERPDPRTVYYRDRSRTIIATNDSPDVPFEASLNPYRGCEHGCAYCYARPTHEYLGLSAGLDFETRILVKEDAPELLRRELSSPKWTPKEVAMSGVTDCYQPVERKLEVTRRCLQVFAEFRNPVGVITKNALVARDADILGDLAKDDAAAAYLSITTLDRELARTLEPRASTPENRLQAIRELARAGVPVGVMVAPLIPGLNDHEMPAILEAAAQAGATSAGMVLLRLPYGVTGIFEKWLDQHYPARKEKVLNQLRESRGGKLYDGAFGSRMRGWGILAGHYEALFAVAKKRAGLTQRGASLSTEAFRKPSGPHPGAKRPESPLGQLELF
ncbi:MAG: PA0069 family radical SAM protein [Elusimicrobia bacterium]|nr:PA0069 family radical SAM protein [Elusimicrobiota bacterium]